MILSKLFIPIAMMLGVEWSDAESIAGLIGMKMFINEFVAYQQLSEYIAIGSITVNYCFVLFLFLFIDSLRFFVYLYFCCCCLLEKNFRLETNKQTLDLLCLAPYN